MISGEAEAKGVKMVHGGFQVAQEALSAERFDCVVLSNVSIWFRIPPLSSRPCGGCLRTMV